MTKKRKPTKASKARPCPGSGLRSGGKGKLLGRGGGKGPMGRPTKATGKR